MPAPRLPLTLALAAACSAVAAAAASGDLAVQTVARAASCGATGAEECPVAAGGGAVPGAPMHAAREHLLLQASVVKAVIGRHSQNASSADSCQSTSVRRRRRNAEMWSCRRRHSSAGYADTDEAEAMWTCDEQRGQMVCDPSRAPPEGGGGQAIGFPGTGAVKAEGLWCAVRMPPDDWNLKACPPSGASKTTVKVLTYNLFWWNLFKKRGGSGRSAGKLIAQTSGPEEYDIMAFQECDDRYRVINDAKLEGLSGEYEALDAGRGMALAYRTSRWTMQAKGSEDVGEDDARQHYGKRAAGWVRLRHRDGKTVFFVSHHGPLPVGWGGGCTGSATAHNIMRVIAENAHPDDAIVLVGDFNAPADSSRIRELDRRLNRVFSGTEMGGVDHIFTNCASDAEGTNLGKGRGEFGSDHDALSVKFKF